MKFLSVCSGIEAASVAWSSLGWKAIAFSEVDPFACAVLAHHYPDVPNLGDMTAIARRVLQEEVEAPDVLCGGTPCQAFSVAGLRESLADERGNLTLKFVELADAIDFVRVRGGRLPAIVFWENVPGVLSTKDNAFGCFLAGLAGEDEPLRAPGGKWANAGCVYGPARAVAWRTLDAQYFGLAQRRRRVFVVASARNGFDPATVLFEWDGVRRDTAPSREAGQDATAGAGAGTSSSGGQPYAHREIAPTLTSNYGKQPDSSDTSSGQMLLPVTHTLRGEGFDASEDGTGRGTPLVPVAGTLDAYHGNIRAEHAWTGRLLPVAFSAKDYGGDAIADLSPTLRAGGHANSHANAGVMPAIAFPANLSGTQCATTERLSPAIGAKNPTAVAYGFQPRIARNGRGDMGGVVGTLSAQSGETGKGDAAPCVATAMQVRRLTPTECSRLQGFPSNYLDIPYRGKPAADGPKYKALGNSWAVPVVRWIGRRIDDAIRRAA